MFNLLYVTDLHGWQQGYNKVLNFAIDNNIKVIINGGDMLPKGSEILKQQKDFILKFFPTYLKKCSDYGIKYYAMFGNDDCKSRLKYWKECINSNGNLVDYSFEICQRPVKIEKDIFLYGFNYVPDYPFRLKDWCCLDYRGWKKPEQDPIGIESSSEKGFVNIDVDNLLTNRPTIQEFLERFPQDIDWSKTIFVSHCPPKSLMLSHTYQREDVGSSYILNWISHKQPLLALHGHIHESPQITGCYKMNIDNTMCVQPGQQYPNNVCGAYIEVEEVCDYYGLPKKQIIIRSFRLPT